MLLEAIVAAGFFAVAACGVLQLAVLAVALHADAGERTRSAAAVEDGLRGLAAQGSALEPGGSLEDDRPGYADAPETGVARRWAVAAGPVPGTLSVAVRVVNRRIRLGSASLEASGLVAVPGLAAAPGQP